MLAAAGLVVIVALAAAVVVLALKVRHDDNVNSARTQALAAGHTYAIELGSYSYKTLATDFGKIEANSTPSFAATYRTSTNTLTKLLIQFKASSTATVQAMGVQSVTTHQATLLVFLNQTSTSSNSKTPSTTHSRIQMTLLNHNGRWLINNIGEL